MRELAIMVVVAYWAICAFLYFGRELNRQCPEVLDDYHQTLEHIGWDAADVKITGYALVFFFLMLVYLVLGPFGKYLGKAGRKNTIIAR